MLYTSRAGFQQRLGKSPHFRFNPSAGQRRLDDVDTSVHSHRMGLLAMKSTPKRLKTVFPSLRLGV
tara:strand:- start:647 stop:844 length:198 start_codon:yes stop_codon:yes gene_type:complete